MVQPLKVFLSYSHEPEDRIFTRELAIRLRQRGHEVWLDEEKIVPSQRDQKAVRGGILTSDHAIFIVSKEWLERDWTQYELELFTKEKPKSRRVALLREMTRVVQQRWSRIDADRLAALGRKCQGQVAGSTGDIENALLWMSRPSKRSGRLSGRRKGGFSRRAPMTAIATP